MACLQGDEASTGRLGKGLHSRMPMWVTGCGGTEARTTGMPRVRVSYFVILQACSMKRKGLLDGRKQARTASKIIGGVSEYFGCA